MSGPKTTPCDRTARRHIRGHMAGVTCRRRGEDDGALREDGGRIPRGNPGRCVPGPTLAPEAHKTLRGASTPITVAARLRRPRAVAFISRREDLCHTGAKQDQQTPAGPGAAAGAHGERGRSASSPRRAPPDQPGRCEQDKVEPDQESSASRYMGGDDPNGRGRRQTCAAIKLRCCGDAAGTSTPAARTLKDRHHEAMRPRHW